MGTFLLYFNLLKDIMRVIIILVGDIMDKMTFKNTNTIDLKAKFHKALENKYFCKICKSLELPEETLMRYTSTLKSAAKEFENCSNCSGLNECKNEINGNLFKAFKNDEGINFSYVECKYKTKYNYQKNVTYYSVPLKLREASIANVYNDDNSRKEVLKMMKKFKDSFLADERPKGIYLYGNFGCGKSYLIAALFNDLAKKDVRSVIVHVPELLRSIKDSFDTDYSERFYELMNTPLLLLDDIGAEYLTEWARDEVIEPILQYRMDQELPTFFTSNYSIKELEKHFIVNGDQLKARRIMERIKQVSTPVELIGEDRRK